jgi:hypothetical protein
MRNIESSNVRYRPTVTFTCPCLDGVGVHLSDKALSPIKIMIPTFVFLHTLYPGKSVIVPRDSEIVDDDENTIFRIEKLFEERASVITIAG